MDLKIATNEDRQKWDTLIANSHGGTIFHTMRYLECLEAHTRTFFLNHPVRGVLYPMVAREGAVIVALFPLFFYSFHGIRIVRSGYDHEDTRYLGPVFMEDDSLKPSKLQIRALRLQKELDFFLKHELKARNVHLFQSPFYPDARPYLWNGYDVRPAHTYFFDLDRGTDTIWADFNKGVRKIIINAQKSGVSVEQGGLEEAEFIFDLLDAKNKTNSSRAFVLDLVKKLSPDNCSIFIASLEGKPLSGVIVLHYGRYAHFWIGFPGSDKEYLGANELLMWEVIRWAHAKGYHLLENTGGDDLSTFQFKRKFNPAVKQYSKIDGSPSSIFRCYRYMKKLFFSSNAELESEREDDDKNL